MSRRSTRVVFACTAVLLGCQPQSDVGVAIQPAIYGGDSRVELEAYPDATQREVGRASVFAMSRAHWFDEWELCDSEDLRSTARTHGEVDELCPDVRFADQLAIADCSATLIDDDLILTANHCVVDEEACSRTRFVGGLYLEPDGELHRITRDDVYHCARFVAAPDGRDLVILQLDRPVSAPYHPARVSARSVEIGDPLAVVGFPAGLPMKVAADCNVLGFTPSGAAFRNNCDVFGGNSGSGVFDAAGEVVGVMTLGGGSYRPDPERDGCRVLTEYDLEGRLLTSPMAAPQLSVAEMMGSAIESLCASGWPTSLCGSAAVCGDTRCTGRESFADCPEDCIALSCGDGRCSPGEDYTCVDDCGMRDPAECTGPIVDAGIDAGADAGTSADSDASIESDSGAPIDAARSDAGTQPAPSSGCACGIAARPRQAGLPSLALGVLVALALRSTRRRRRR